MTWSYPIGRLFGTELRLHVTFLMLLAWIGTAAWLTDGPAAAVENVLFIAALFACVVAHEFGHALTARRYGIATADVTLLPIGGVARLERLPEAPVQELAVALAGPAVNVVIWAALNLIAGGLPLGGLDRIEDADLGFVPRLAALNLGLALFNLLPAFPMDGGRVLRALLSIRFGRVRATRIAVAAGQALAAVLGLWGLTGGGPFVVLIAVFVFMAASAEQADVLLRAAAREYRARDAMIASFESLSPADTLDAAGRALLHTTQHEFPVLDAQGRPVGFLTRQALFRAMAEDGRQQSVASVMTAEVPTVAPSARLETVLDALQRRNTPAVAVLDGEGRCVGYITAENLGELMVLARAGSRAR